MTHNRFLWRMPGTVTTMLLAIGLFMFLVPGVAPAQGSLPVPMVIAHRGVVTETITENSLQSLDAAIERGYTHIEVDLRPTKDGHAVCLHDRSLKRTTGIEKNLDDVTLAELRELVSKDKVPSFAEFCDHAAGRIQLMADIKDSPRDLIAAFAASIDKTMTKHGLFDQALFIGRPDIGRRFFGKGRLAWRAPLERVQKSDRANDEPGKYYFIFNHGADFEKSDVDGFHELGLLVVVSINTFHYKTGDPIQGGLDHIREMISLGVDGLQIDSLYDHAVFK